MSGMKKITGRGQGVSQGGGRGKGGAKETNNKEKDDGVEGKAGEAEGDGATGVEGN